MIKGESWLLILVSQAIMQGHSYRLVQLELCFFWNALRMDMHAIVLIFAFHCAQGDLLQLTDIRMHQRAVFLMYTYKEKQ